MSIEDLEADLARARDRVKKVMAAGVPAVRSKEWQELGAAYEAQHAAERALALAKGEEAALPLPWEVPWDLGAPSPHVVSRGGYPFLIYLVSEPDPEWDGTYVTVVDPGAPVAFPLALVELIGCYAYKFGGSNDEVFEGLPLRGKGLGSYGAYLIANSTWLAELERINSVHHLYHPSRWHDDKHYMLLFHDEMF